MHVELIAITQYLHGSVEELIEHAGRVCYRSTAQEGQHTARFIRARVEQGHESIVEHASATFEIGGISRACSHQLVRHRIASYSQESQRYVAMSDPTFVLPASVARRPAARAVWARFRDAVQTAYRELRALEVPKEDARFVLPNATATRIVMTMNFRELLHFFRLRISPAAQWEIRQVALAMLEQLAPRAPAVFGDMLEDVRDAHPEFFSDAAP